MSADPFFITGPALISFSGGRTSAYMLWRILQAHGGTLPQDVAVAFANTGKERGETLRFVHECATRWGVHVHWLEWSDGEPGYQTTGFNSASRSGEPFSALIRKKGYLPNRGAGYCSIELKGRVIRDFCVNERGWKNWTSVIGLRADEKDRVFSSRKSRERWRNATPLFDAEITRRDVKAFWAAQDFDLGLLDYEGNCDLCWKKSRAKLARTIHDNPVRALWWMAQERSVDQAQTGSRFNLDYSFSDLVRQVRQQRTLAFVADPAWDDHDAECGLWCPVEAA